MPGYPVIQRSEIEKVPYLKAWPDGGRIPLLVPFFDHAKREWIILVPVSDGRLIPLAGSIPIRLVYGCGIPAFPDTDPELPLATLVFRHLSFAGVLGALAQIESDVHHFAVIMEKHEVLSRAAGDPISYGSFLLSSELEHLLGVIRSSYDLLQTFVRQACGLMRQAGAESTRVVADLPTSFAKVALDGSTPRSATDLVSRFRLPPPLVEFYVAEASRFLRLRDLRNEIEHHGKEPPSVVRTDSGLAVLAHQAPWASLGIWPEATLIDGRLGSLRGLFAFLIKETIDMTTRFGSALATCAELPRSVNDDVRLYVRNPFGRHLVQLDQTLAQPWNTEHC